MSSCPEARPREKQTPVPNSTAAPGSTPVCLAAKRAKSKSARAGSADRLVGRHQVESLDDTRRADASVLAEYASEPVRQAIVELFPPHGIRLVCEAPLQRPEPARHLVVTSLLRLPVRRSGRTHERFLLGELAADDAREVVQDLLDRQGVVPLENHQGAARRSGRPTFRAGHRQTEPSLLPARRASSPSYPTSSGF